MPALPFPDRMPRRRSRNPTKRTRKTTTRLSDDEHAEIAAAARARGITVARFLATTALTSARGSTPAHSNERLDAGIDELAALRTALARIGNNLNQITRTYNAGGEPREGALDHALAVLVKAVARLDETADALVKRRL